MKTTARSPGKHATTSTPASRMATSFPRKAAACLSLLLIGSAWTGAAHALCGRPHNGMTYPDSTPIAPLPTTIKLDHVGIGQPMTKDPITVPLALTISIVPNWSWCGNDGQYGLTTPKTTLQPSNIPGVYETGIPGVGVRIKLASDSNNGFWSSAAPFERSTPNTGGTLFAPTKAVFEFVRTAMGVGKGSFSFDYETQFFIDTNYTTPKRPHYRIVGTSLRTSLEQDTYFTSCHTPRTVTDVNMGRAVVAEIKLGQAKEHAFSLDVQCEGMNPATKPPVKVYFEGNAVRDGLLNLDGGGAANAAKGVGIAVTNDKGKDVPFTKGGALPLTWQSSEPNLERYRFSGKARYVATTGEMTAGKADATLTYVLQYE
ncbi:fimbrial protein [Pseudoxanthomonas sp. 22568]|uniref:fimbrial protein n=1 Tax=Pseudoxanthomonas sp. 22568 TaxID=3453945 RepID=UPI00296F1848|nr:fimbrial protein [Pseudoxanthomonas japonensis]